MYVMRLGPKNDDDDNNSSNRNTNNIITKNKNILMTGPMYA